MIQLLFYWKKVLLEQFLFRSGERTALTLVFCCNLYRKTAAHFCEIALALQLVIITAFAGGGGGAQNLPDVLIPDDVSPYDPFENSPEILPENPLSLEELLPEKEQTAKQALDNEATQHDQMANSAAARKATELDRLFILLRRTFDREEAGKISRQIHGLWAQSGSDTVDLLMQWAEKAIVTMDYPQALDFLDNVITLRPDFTEGWMRRASIHIQRNDLTLAMLDLNEVLKLEPRHYQAMSQLGLIMEMTKRPQAAVAIYEQALILYPQFGLAQRRLGNLLDEMDEQSL